MDIRIQNREVSIHIWYPGLPRRGQSEPDCGTVGNVGMPLPLPLRALACLLPDGLCRKEL